MSEIIALEGRLDTLKELLEVAGRVTNKHLASYFSCFPNIVDAMRDQSDQIRALERKTMLLEKKLAELCRENQGEEQNSTISTKEA